MHHNQTREGLERHIRILTEFEKLKKDGFSGTRGEAARQISKILDIGEMRVYNTIYNHDGKLDRFREELREFSGEVVANTEDELPVDSSGATLGVDESSVGRLKSLWKDLLGIISGEGYSMEKEWYERVASRLGLSGTEELREMLEVLFDSGYLRKFEVGTEDGGEEGALYLVSSDGRLVATGEKEIMIEGEEVVDDNESGSVEEPEEVTIKEDFFAVMDFVLNEKVVPMTPLDHKLMRERLNIPAEKLESIIRDLVGGGYLAEEDEKLKIGEGIVRVHGENWPIEFTSPEGEVAEESSVETDEDGVTIDGAEVVLVTQEEPIEQTEVGEIDNLQRLLKYIEGPGAIRLMDESFVRLEWALGLSEEERITLLRKAETNGFLEDNGRAALAITSTGRKYLETKSRGSVESNSSENKPSGRLLAAE